jgi:MFS family permease
MAAAAGHGYPAMVPAMMLAGVGVSMAMPAVQTATVGAVPPSAIGQASGVYNAMRQLGGAFGIAILSAVFTAHGGFTSIAAIGYGFRAAMVVAAAVSAAGGPRRGGPDPPSSRRTRPPRTRGPARTRLRPILIGNKVNPFPWSPNSPNA